MRRERRFKNNHRKLTKFGYLLILTFLTIFIIIIFFLIYLSRLDKFIVLNRLDDGAGELVIIDPSIDKVKKYYINSETVLDSSRGYGEYKLKNLWTLAEKEGLGGKLVVESVAKNYSLPVYLWNDNRLNNLNIFQKTKLFFISNTNDDYESEIESRELSKNILINFINADVQESQIQFEIIDLTGNQKVIDNVSTILGTLGTKVSSYSKGYNDSLDCEVSGTVEQITKLISKIFDCKVLDINTENGIKIRLGEVFADRF